MRMPVAPARTSPQRALLHACGLVALMLPAACRDAIAPSPSILSVSITDAGPLVKRVDVELEVPGSVRVVYGTSANRLEVEATRQTTSHSLLVTRLHADSRYDYEVRAHNDVVAGEFRTGALPAALAAVEFTASGTSTMPLTMLEFARLGEASAYGGVAIVDRDGRVVWYFPAPHGITGTARRGNGNFVFLDGDRGLLEVSVSGEILASLPQDADRTLHHEVIAAPGDVFWALRLDRRPVNDTLVAGEAIWEWNPVTGTEIRRWSSFDALDPVDDRGLTYSAGDWLHANSLSIGPRGNVVVSLHHLDQAISIAPGFGALEWRLGGRNATIAPAVSDRFSGQHTAAEIEPGRVLMFDNGFQRTEPFSRGLELEMSGNAAQSVWQFRPQRVNWSRAVGAARRIANGNTLVTFGMSTGLGGSTGPVEVYESTSAGGVAWHLEIGGNVQILYRATPLTSIAGEREAR